MATLFYNGTIYTMTEEMNTVNAVLIHNGKVEKTGKYEELETEANAFVDLDGKTMMPALTDVHQHLVMIGKKLELLALDDVTDIDEMKQQVKAFKTNRTWNNILGYDENNFEDQYKITMQELDELTDKPTLITRICAHAGVVNKKAFDALNITKDTPDPEGGYFERDENGELTGWVYDKAFEEMRAATVEDTVESLGEDIARGVKYLQSLGIANSHTEDLAYYGDFNVPLDAYLNTLGEDALKFRVNLLTHEQVYEDVVAADKTYKENFVERDAMKIFADGAFGAKTALVSEPYVDSTDKGLQIHTVEKLERMVQTARSNNDAVAVHMIGDRAIEMVLDAIEKYPVPEGKHDRLIHISLLRPDLIERIAKLPVVCDIQPTFLTSDMPWVADYVGEERAKYLYPFKTLLDKGVIMGGSSDAPIEKVNPFLGIHALITREDNGAVYNADEIIPRYDAFKMYTVEAAKIVYRENVQGKIAEGYFADFIVLDRDVMTVTPEELKETKVLKTIIDGDTVFEL
ncbi:N-substituted formamide deformylase precursor [Jeotgalicoccus saudimassiliensis]|uniref:N-substituted formamide deformylase n=1 Tax=Jeotgalicoccus saudimassiliensis TaxID=1461582 RepID=A0A078M4L0_9STAP|nr:amidohydrolase [Jeotgalicoccus saudimassiliensis]CEA01235.1 N-substituted formamide deformylase precursor [Jeotgalicoccus saudimassiliensis]